MDIIRKLLIYLIQFQIESTNVTKLGHWFGDKQFGQTLERNLTNASC